VIRVLVVDDEPTLLRALVLNLTHRGYRVSTATTGAAAISQAAIYRPELMILDLGLPDINGLDVITHVLRVQPDLAILVLSARTGSTDKVSALDLGALDYVTKPFSIDELLARLRAATRRFTISEAPAVTTIGAVTIDLAARLIRHRDGADHQIVHLTPTEWRMLEVLLRNPGSLVTTTELLTVMRGQPEHTERSYLRIYMQQLRRKLEPDPARPQYLLTEPGMGYRYMP
jgi:two-component system KDP operon response regulator KdpE